MNAQRPRPILVVEDDPNIAALVERYLAAAGFETIIAADGTAGLDLARMRNPQLIVLDVMLPGIDGFEVCRALRRSSDVPVVMLTAREAEADRIVGFSLGADDYVVKPFSPRELVERVKAVLRRSQPETAGRRERLRAGPLELEPDKYKVTLDGRAIPLTLSEFTLLHVLAAARGRAFSRGELLAHLYPNGESVVDRVVDVHIGKLRQKIETSPSSPSYILTVRGVGYRFADASELAS